MELPEFRVTLTRLVPRGKNILICESTVEISGIGWLVRWDDEFQINGQ